MENRSSSKTRAKHHLITACAAALAAAIALPMAAKADEVTPPPGPFTMQPGNEAFLVGHATGSQNYVCLPSGTGVAYKLFTPEATLFNDDGKQIITHFFDPNPFERNTSPALIAVGPVRAAWQSSRDASIVWGQVKDPSRDMSSDPVFVAKNAIPWLLVTIVGHDAGPTGGASLTATTFIQRVNTSGGAAPSTGCSSSADIGNQAFVPYTADYFFFRAATDGVEE